jgi:hypothetical protein
MRFDCQGGGAVAVGGEELFPDGETLMLGCVFDYEDEEVDAFEVG